MSKVSTVEIIKPPMTTAVSYTHLGSFKPAGLEYKYPNVLSYEGVRGMEQMGGCYSDNSLYLPFMRNAVGPMDYTPGAMISMQPNVYRSERPNAASIGTRAYQLA